LVEKRSAPTQTKKNKARVVKIATTTRRRRLLARSRQI
jgi:hypothetical protein